MQAGWGLMLVSIYCLTHFLHATIPSSTAQPLQVIGMCVDLLNFSSQMEQFLVSSFFVVFDFFGWAALAEAVAEEALVAEALADSLAELIFVLSYILQT
jgi:hypothetical protein